MDHINLVGTGWHPAQPVQELSGVGMGRGGLQLHDFSMHIDITSVYAYAFGTARQRCTPCARRLVARQYYHVAMVAQVVFQVV